MKCENQFVTACPHAVLPPSNNTINYIGKSITWWQSYELGKMINRSTLPMPYLDLTWIYNINYTFLESPHCFSCSKSMRKADMNWRIEYAWELTVTWVRICQQKMSKITIWNQNMLSYVSFLIFLLIQSGRQHPIKYDLAPYIYILVWDSHLILM